MFLCPVCARRLVGERGLDGRPCSHLLLVHDRSGLAYCRDEGVRAAFTGVARRLDPRGAAGKAELERNLGPGAVFFDLLDDPAGAPALTLAIEVRPRS